LRVLTLSWNGSPARTDFGASAINSVGFFSAGPTSPNSVETHRSPFWNPSCGANRLLPQSLARISSPLTFSGPELSPAFEIWVTPISPPKTTTAAAAPSRRRSRRGRVAARR
jgi:hypothetical protein